MDTTVTKEVIDSIQRNNNFTDKQLLLDLTRLFYTHKEAWEFLYLYGQCCELEDDQVDEEKDVDRTEKLSRMRAAITNHSYWIKHQQWLFLVERLVHNTYYDSVKWESAEEEWKRRDAKCLSHCGYNILFAVIYLEFGEEVMASFTLRFREHAHLKHINDML